MAWAIGDSLGDRVGKEMAARSSVLARKPHGQRGAAGASPRGHRRGGHNLAAKQQQRGDGGEQTGG